MSKINTIQIIKENVYENINNEVTGDMVQTAMIEIVNDEYNELGKKQNNLVSGTNIKTINNNSLLGSGNINITPSSIGAYTKAEVDALANTKVPKTTTINGKPLTGNVTLAASDVNALPNNTKYAGSDTQGGAAYSANKVNSTLILQQNGTTSATFNGSVNTTINITPSSIGTYTKSEVDNRLNAKQNNLVSGTNIKTINSNSLVGSGNVVVQPTLVSGTNIKTINGNSILGSGDISVGAGVNVVDNLTSTSSTDALSAKQGKILKDLITPIVTKTNITKLNGITYSNLDTYASYYTAIKQGNIVAFSFNVEFKIVKQEISWKLFSFTTQYECVNPANTSIYGVASINDRITYYPLQVLITPNSSEVQIGFNPLNTNLNKNDIQYVSGCISYLTTVN